jgi:glyoxylase-like metal-dependent hydrolase (beta-lactamase superfamily II)
MKSRWPIALAVALLCPDVSDAQEAEGAAVSLESYERARAILESAVEALGGRERLEASRDLAIDLEGELHWRHQSLRPEPPYDVEPFRATFLHQPSRGRLVYENEWRLGGGFRGHSRQVILGEEGFSLDLLRRTVSETPDPPPISDHFYVERVPHLLLLRILESPESLRSLGSVEVDGRTLDAIAAVDDGNQETLLFDAATGLLSAYELVISHPIDGDAVQRRAWDGYRAIDGVQVPERYRQWIGGGLMQDYRFVGVRLGTSAADSLFERPAAFDPAPAPSWPSSRVTEVAPGVYFLEGAAPGYNMLSVELGDSLLVVEAPLGSDAMEAAIGVLREAVPGKPIAHVVPTHHHDDHAGGLRAFVAAGVTVVTTPGNVEFFRAMASAPRTIDPDVLVKSPREPRIEPIEGKERVIEKGGHRVEIHDIGPSPHAGEMVVVWLPREGILFQGDLLNAGSDGSLQPANDTTRHFADWLEEGGIRPRTILGVHSPARTMADLERALAMPEELE